MKCPMCRDNTPDSWRPFVASQAGGGHSEVLAVNPPEMIERSYVNVAYMYCANDSCRQLVIRVHEHFDVMHDRRSWLARPHVSSRPIDPLVPEPHRTDYLEAAGLLDVSPRMSAVLARRIVGDLLKAYAGKAHWSLSARIRSFVNDGNHPSGLTTNLEHLREIADFGAHTQEAEQESETGEMEVVIIDTDRDDAEWTLDLLDRLFDYLIVTPARDEAMKSKWDENIKKTGRKELRSSGESTDAES